MLMDDLGSEEIQEQSFWQQKGGVQNFVTIDCFYILSVLLEGTNSAPA
jgi:hypothetical protein